MPAKKSTATNGNARRRPGAKRAPRTESAVAAAERDAAIRALAAGGLSPLGIRAALQGAGIRTPRGGKRWPVNAIAGIIARGAAAQ